MQYRNGLIKLITLCMGCIMTCMIALPIFALPAVESRRGQPQTRTTNENFSGSYAAPNVYEGEPLIPVNTPVSNNAAINASVVQSSMPANAEERAARLTLREMESLQREVSELRGIIEVQDHEIKQLKKSQQDFYMDLDRRLTQLQSSGTPNGVTAAASKAAAATTAAKEIKNKSTTSPSESAKSKKSAEVASSGTKAPASPKPTELDKNRKSLDPEIANSKSQKTDIDAKITANVHSNINVSKPNPNGSAENSVNAAANSAKVTNGTNGAIAQTAPAQTSPKIEGEETLSYQNAYNLLKTKRYEEAIQAFQKHISQFPQGEHAVNAHYWLGEVYMVQWQGNKTNPALLDSAEASFSKIAQGYPNHTKSADAALKLGLIALDKGNQEAGRQQLMQVKSRYPGTTAARVADSRLQQLH